jgi:alkanesulfonate monooxygenase SsuD/methylene tetrahydromethanopterin reductase-like flavin-dependent oxidoreductase (luciferase family)
MRLIGTPVGSLLEQAYLGEPGVQTPGGQEQDTGDVPPTSEDQRPPMTEGSTKYGVLFSGNFPLQRALAGAVLADRLGFDSCWLGEDYFYQGGIATATAVAERTVRVTIGLGILTPLARHPALTVMEVGTLDQIANGRILLGYGAGVRFWMEQMKLDYRSPLSAMREAVEISRELFAGATSNYRGRYFHLDNVRLGFAPHRREMPIYLGAEGPKALQLSGEVCDGTILSVLAGPQYLRFARENIALGCERGGRDPHAHKLVVYVIFAMDDDGAEARDAVRMPIAEYLGTAGQANALSTQAGVPDELMRELGRVYREEARIPTELIDDETVSRVAVAGTPEECADALRGLIDAGADEIAFFPFPSERTEQTIERIAAELLPRLRA